MPLTYLSHQAAVLPLKMWRPSCFDGTALVFGSMAPDWAYVFNGSHIQINAHRWPAALWFALPTAVFATLVARRFEPQLIAGLPVAPRWLRDVACRRPVRHSLLLVVASAALGVLTHIVWDMFTHNFRWGAQHIHWLRESMTIGSRTMTHAQFLQEISTVGGAIVTVALLAWVGHRRAALQWRSESRPVIAPRLDWRVLTVTVVAVAVGAWWASAAHHDLASGVNRLVLTAGAGYVAAAAIFLSRDPTEERHADEP